MASKRTTERLKAIQRRFGVDDDGVLGPDTLTRIELPLDESLGPDEASQEFSLTCSRRGLEKLVFFEISSLAYYRRFLSHPTWPKGHSGITIGIGYDLGYHRSMKRLWDADVLPGLHVRRDTEADMIAHARSDYEQSELIRV